MTSIERIEQMLLDNFIQQYAQQPFELVDGEKRLIMPNVAIHQLVLRALFRFLDVFCAANQSGEVLFELPMVEVYNQEWVKGSRTPDLMFFSALKWSQYTTETEHWLKKPALIVPDLAVEIVSPNDSFSDIETKVAEYLARGVALVWVIDPQKRRIYVYRDHARRTLAEGDSLLGETVLPGFELALADLFKGL